MRSPSQSDILTIVIMHFIDGKNQNGDLIPESKKSVKVMEQKRKVKGLLKDTRVSWLYEVTGLKGACRGKIKAER